MGGKSSAPPAPDYTAAAKATADSQRNNYTTPYGSQTWSQGKDGTYTNNVTLSPDQQKLLDQQNQTSLQLGNLQGAATNRVGQMLGQGFDTSSLPSAPINPGQTAQQAIMARLQPQFDRSDEQLRNRLANQGIMPGSEAYNNEISLAGQNKNDAYSQAALQGINLDTGARKNAFDEQSYLRQLPLNELNALRSGSQVQNPNFSGAPKTGVDMTGAMQNQYQAQLGATNANNANNAQTWSTVGQLGGLAAAFMF